MQVFENCIKEEEKRPLSQPVRKRPKNGKECPECGRLFDDNASLVAHRAQHFQPRDAGLMF